jgi:hypothetical protein
MALVPVFDVTCALLVVAGLIKAWSPAGAREALRGIGLSVSAGAVRALAVAEVTVGVAAAIRPGVLAGVVVAGTYAAFCAFVVVLLRVADRPVGCGCFGDAETGAGRIHVWLNAAACGAGVLAAVSPPPGLAWILDRPALVAFSLILGTGAAALAAYLVYTAFPSAWRAYRTGALS